MRRKLLVILTLSLFCGQIAFSQKRLVVLSSSTAEGVGASSYDSSWVGRVQREYRKNSFDLDTSVVNLAVGGFVSYQVMPTGYTPPPSRPFADPEHNVSKALSLFPDVIIINLPTNDVGSGYSEAEFMNNLRYLYTYITSRGVGCFITTTQPRTYFSFEQRKSLFNLKDSILNAFTLKAINFWDDLVSTEGQYYLRAEVNSGDGTHLNDLGHRLVAQKVKDKNVFGGTAPPTTTKIEAESYMSMSGVQTENTLDQGGGQNVGWIEQGDWMDYQVSVASPGTYTLNIRVATPNSGAQLQLRKADGSVLSTVNLPNTGWWQTWQTISTTITLQAGTQSIRVISTAAAGWNINWMELSAGGSAPPPAVTTRIEAENYTSMSGVQTENTWDEGGGQNVGWIEQGDWMDYNVNVASGGSYTLKLRIATPNTGAQFQIRKQDGSVLSTVNLTSTWGYQSWQTISTTITLQAGVQSIRVISTAAPGWNINWMEINAVGAITSARQRDLLQAPIENSSSFEVYPNPVTDRLTFSINDNYAGKLRIEILNMTGAVVKQFNLNKERGLHRMNLALGFLKGGSYILRITTDQGTQSK